MIYLPSHTNHSLIIEEEAKSIPLTWTSQAAISANLQKGISVDKIMEGIEGADINYVAELQRNNFPRIKYLKK